mmetsp:Transcript_22019/g.64936  ORF Transcript_22019/g.64936 Transcript_22019/m.64936 type:complete len:560 (+) Transcript_22019:1995-3674(+)
MHPGGAVVAGCSLEHCRELLDASELQHQGLLLRRDHALAEHGEQPRVRTVRAHAQPAAVQHLLDAPPPKGLRHGPAAGREVEDHALQLHSIVAALNQELRYRPVQIVVVRHHGHEVREVEDHSLDHVVVVEQCLAVVLHVVRDGPHDDCHVEQPREPGRFGEQACALAGGPQLENLLLRLVRLDAEAIDDLKELPELGEDALDLRGHGARTRRRAQVKRVRIHAEGRRVRAKVIARHPATLRRARGGRRQVARQADDPRRHLHEDARDGRGRRLHVHLRMGQCAAGGVRGHRHRGLVGNRADHLLDDVEAAVAHVIGVVAEDQPVHDDGLGMLEHPLAHDPVVSAELPEVLEASDGGGPVAQVVAHRADDAGHRNVHALALEAVVHLEHSIQDLEIGLEHLPIRRIDSCAQPGDDLGHEAGILPRVKANDELDRLEVAVLLDELGDEVRRSDERAVAARHRQGCRDIVHVRVPDGDRFGPAPVHLVSARLARRARAHELGHDLDHGTEVWEGELVSHLALLLAVLLVAAVGGCVVGRVEVHEQLHGAVREHPLPLVGTK